MSSPSRVTQKPAEDPGKSNEREKSGTAMRARGKRAWVGPSVSAVRDRQRSKGVHLREKYKEGGTGHALNGEKVWHAQTRQMKKDEVHEAKHKARERERDIIKLHQTECPIRKR